MFGEVGYDAATFQEVAVRADLTRPAVNHHFRSKRDLYRQVAEQTNRTVIEAGVVDTEFARSTVISGAVGTPATPYAAPRDAILGRLRAVRGDAPVRAQDVADAVFAAADDPDAPLHVVLADEVLRDPVFDVEGRGPSAAVLDGVRALFEF